MHRSNVRTLLAAAAGLAAVLVASGAPVVLGG
jgi:hypothetical protein